MQTPYLKNELEMTDRKDLMNIILRLKEEELQDKLKDKSPEDLIEIILSGQRGEKRRKKSVKHIPRELIDRSREYAIEKIKSLFPKHLNYHRDCAFRSEMVNDLSEIVDEGEWDMRPIYIHYKDWGFVFIEYFSRIEFTKEESYHRVVDYSIIFKDKTIAEVKNERLTL